MVVFSIGFFDRGFWRDGWWRVCAFTQTQGVEAVYLQRTQRGISFVSFSASDQRGQMHLPGGEVVIIQA